MSSETCKKQKNGIHHLPMRVLQAIFCFSFDSDQRKLFYTFENFRKLERFPEIRRHYAIRGTVFFVEIRLTMNGLQVEKMADEEKFCQNDEDEINKEVERIRQLFKSFHENGLIDFDRYSYGSQGIFFFLDMKSAVHAEVVDFDEREDDRNGWILYPYFRVENHLQSEVVSLHGNNNAVCALKRDGTVRVWGERTRGGRLTTSLNYIRVHVMPVDVWTICMTTHAFAAIGAEGTLFTWGTASLGGNVLEFYEEPIPKIVDLKTNYQAFRATIRSGETFDWGETDRETPISWSKDMSLFRF